MRTLLLLLLAALALGPLGCRREPDAPRVLRVWCHQGQEAENAAMRGIVRAFNEAHAGEGLRVDVTFFPDFQYAEKVAIAAAARDLPDALDLDGPLVARFVAAGILQPLTPAFSAEELDDFLPSIRAQGTIDGRLYALGAFDSAVVLYYDRAMLTRAGVEPPAPGQAWTWDEFLTACAKLKQAGMNPVALHMNEGADEWFTYAFSPVVWSGGGRLIGDDGRQVRGVLASAANVRSLGEWQQLFARGYAATDPVDHDPFGHGRTAMDWDGHWMARSHLEAKGGQLGAMPLPTTGDRQVAACGSWCWAITAGTRRRDGAIAWLRWVTDPRHGIEPVVRANGAVPARKSAFGAFPEYARPPYRLFREQAELARPRPRTPYYATLTAGFAAALRDIAHGAEVGPRMRTAENEIQAVIDRRTGGAGEEAR